MMKRIILFYFCMFACQIGFCQQHLTFLDIPITGTQDEFVGKLRQKGDYIISKKQNTYRKCSTITYDGKFEKWALCSIDLNVRDGQKNVSFVTVHLDKYAAQTAQILQYLIEKYGNYTKESDKYLTTYEWTLANGKINFNESKIGEDYYINIQFRDNSYYTQEELKNIEHKKNEDDKHISFMGKSLNCDVYDMASFLESKNFQIDWTLSGDNKYMLTGTFLDEPVTLILLYTPKTKKMNSVIVAFPKKHSWQELKSKYFKVKSYYEIKYNLVKCTEEIKPPYYDGCGKEIYALDNNYGIYISLFEAKGGDIFISINMSTIAISYVDEINNKISKEEEVSELNI